jgi:hypothetical protein
LSVPDNILQQQRAQDAWPTRNKAAFGAIDQRSSHQAQIEDVTRTLGLDTVVPRRLTQEKGPLFSIVCGHRRVMLRGSGRVALELDAALEGVQLAFAELKGQVQDRFRSYGL